MSLHEGMKYKQGKKKCTIISVEGNEIKVKCGKKGKPKYVKRDKLESMEFE